MTTDHPPALLQLRLHRLHTPNALLLSDLALDVPAGTVHTVMGASGSGKSSLLAAVCGTLDNAVRFDGTVHLAGQRIDTLPTHSRRVGLLLQDDLLFAHLSVLENLLFAVPAGAKAAPVESGFASPSNESWGAFFVTKPANIAAVFFRTSSASSY